MLAPSVSSSGAPGPAFGVSFLFHALLLILLAVAPMPVPRFVAPAKLYYAPRNLRSIPCSLKNVDVNIVYRPLADFGTLNGDLVAMLF